MSFEFMNANKYPKTFPSYAENPAFAQKFGVCFKKITGHDLR